MPKVPDPPPTPPRGGAHAHVDPAALAERAADRAHDAIQIARHSDDRASEALLLSRKHADIIETIPAMHVKLDLALRPTITPAYVRVSAVAAAAAMIVGACALVALVVILAKPTAASASTQAAGAQASNRIAAPVP
ncbi:MAG TPA: hypothetical protein VGH28_13760 [Polyangiaceae bacterium]|jgi:hypothetical protein